MRLTILVGLVLFSTSLFSQARIVFTNNGPNNAYLVLDNGANLVLDNPATTAFTGYANGRIISEDETNLVKWNIGESTGIYRVPFGYDEGTPGATGDDSNLLLAMTITTAGIGVTSAVEFSTYNTDPGNSVWPSGVMHLNQFNNPGVDNSPFVVDRFYVIDASSYTQRPSVSMYLRYAESEHTTAPNTITESAIKAQRWNETAGIWQDFMPVGTANTAGNFVGPIVANNWDFFKAWALVDNSSPLPIELLDFGTNCDNQRVKVYWSTASETNNNFFSVYKSKDGFDWELVQQVSSAGNSVSTLNYEIWDAEPYAGVSYYKLTQTDINGIETTFGPVSNTCGDFLFEIVSVVSDFNSNSGDVEINVSAGSDEVFDIKLIDLSGKLVATLPHQKLFSGMNKIILNKGNLGMGAYIVQLQSDAHVLTSKVILN